MANTAWSLGAGRGPAGFRRTGESLTLGLASLGAVLVPLFVIWFLGLSHPNAIGGLLPWNDAAGYFGCAVAVLDHDTLTEFCERRPAYSLYLAGLLTLAGNELQCALLLQALVTAGGLWVVAAAVRPRWGLAASLLSIGVVAAFAASNVTTTLTENLGLVLGAAGIVLFLASAQDRSPLRLASGAFILALALNARAGAFFVLPALAAWPFLAGALPISKRWWLSLLILLAALAGSLPGYLLAQIYGAGTGQMHSNFSYTLYGLVAGGERWTFAVNTLTPQGGTLTTDAVYQAAWDLFIRQPHLLARGLFQGWLEYLQRLHLYIGWAPARVAVAACWLWGLASLARSSRTDVERALLVMMAGVMVSAPILSIEGDIRVFAATIALDGIVAAYGLSRLAKAIGRQRGYLPPLVPVLLLAAAPVLAPGDLRAWGGAIVVAAVAAIILQRPAANDAITSERPHAGGVLAAWVLAGLVMAIAGIVPAAARMLDGFTLPDRDANASVPACADTERSIVARLGRDSPVLRLVAREDATTIWPIAIAAEDFRAELSPLTYRHEDLRSLTAGIAIVMARDLAAENRSLRRFEILLGDAATIPVDGRPYRLCVTAGPDSRLPDARAIRSWQAIGQ